MKIFDFQQVIHHFLSLKKKSSPTAAMIVAFTVPEIKKTKNFIKLEYISHTMTLDCKKNLNATKWHKHKIKNKTGGSLYGKTSTQ